MVNEGEQKGLGSAFGDKGVNRNQISYGHPYAREIMAHAREILKESETGRLLLKVSDVHKIPVNIIKGVGESGFSPQARVIYLQVSGKVQKADAVIILKLVKALRDADQELIGFTAPDPLKDLMEYAAVMHAKTLDSVIYSCKVVKELTNTSHFKEMLDGLSKLGHDAVYQAYERNASKDELFDAYADK